MGVTNDIPCRSLETDKQVFPIMRWMPRQHLEQDSAQQVNICLIGRCRMQTIGKLWSHVGWRSPNRLLDAKSQIRAANRQRQAPVSNQNLTKFTQHHIFRFDIPMDQTARVGVADSIGYS